MYGVVCDVLLGIVRSSGSDFGAQIIRLAREHKDGGVWRGKDKVVQAQTVLIYVFTGWPTVHMQGLVRLRLQGSRLIKHQRRSSEPTALQPPSIVHPTCPWQPSASRLPWRSSGCVPGMYVGASEAENGKPLLTCRGTKHDTARFDGREFLLFS